MKNNLNPIFSNIFETLANAQKEGQRLEKEIRQYLSNQKLANEGITFFVESSLL